MKRLLADCGLLGDDIDPHLEHFIVARANGELAGVIGLELLGSLALLRSLAVAPAYRNQGLGGTLYERALAYTRTRGVGTLYLLTLTAREFFARRGFSKVDRKSAPEPIAATQEFRTLCSETADLLVRHISSGDSAHKVNVLFLCTGNSARSILAEAYLNKVGKGRFAAFSAGSHPAGKVNPFALELLAKNRINTTGLRSKNWDEFAKPDALVMDYVFTVCDNAAGEVCPIWPGQPTTAHWGVDDPAKVEGTDEAKRKAFMRAFTDLSTRIDQFLDSPLTR